MPETTDRYERQRSLPLKIPESVCIIGCGGTGNWAGLLMSLIGTRKVILVDPDVIENHNLNRTIFREMDIGKNKTEALTEIILEHRGDIDVIPLPMRIENAVDLDRQDIIDAEVIIDCRDVLSEVHFLNDRDDIIKLGYDGFKATMHTNRKGELVFSTDDGGAARYRTVPSFVVPPLILAAMACLYICTPEIGDSEEEIHNFDVRALLECILDEPDMETFEFEGEYCPNCGGDTQWQDGAEVYECVECGDWFSESEMTQ